MKEKTVSIGGGQEYFLEVVPLHPDSPSTYSNIMWVCHQTHDTTNWQTLSVLSQMPNIIINKSALDNKLYQHNCQIDYPLKWTLPHPHQHWPSLLTNPYLPFTCLIQWFLHPYPLPPNTYSTISISIGTDTNADPDNIPPPSRWCGYI